MHKNFVKISGVIGSAALILGACWFWYQLNVWKSVVPSSPFDSSPLSQEVLQPATAQSVIESINDIRSQSKLDPLQEDIKLTQAARLKIADMCQFQYWGHQSPTGKKAWDFIDRQAFEFDTAGENLARDFQTTQGLVKAWMDSPEHEKNIVNPTYMRTGLAIDECVLEGRPTVLAVQLFASVEGSQVIRSQTDIIDRETVIDCQVSSECGGGVVKLKKWQCENSICCHLPSNEWQFYANKNQCFEDQAQ